MAFDVYVGTLTRFYRREWENVAQRMARERGVKYEMIYTGGKPDDPPPANEVRQAVFRWTAAMSEALRPHGVDGVSWNESDDQPYFTARPAWQGYGALLLLAAYDEHRDLMPPNAVPESWVDDPAFKGSTATDFKTRYRTILEPELWLPAEFPFTFEGGTLAAEQQKMGSTFTLKCQLDDLYSRASEVLGRRGETNGRASATAPRRGLLNSLFGRSSRLVVESTQALFFEFAEAGLSRFRMLADKACENRLPMLLEY